MKNYVYNFGGGTADGDGKMKDVLGGKGAGLAEMCRAGMSRAARIHHLHRSLQHLFPERQQGSQRDQRADSGRARKARRADRQEAGRSRQSAAGQRPLRREVFHARHDEHHSQPGPERRDRGRPGQAHRQSALRLRFLPPLHSDVRRSRAGYRHGEVRPHLR